MSYEYEETLAEMNSPRDDMRERYAASAPDPDVEHSIAMQDLAEEVALHATDAGMTVEEYLSTLEREVPKSRARSGEDHPF